MEAKLVVLRGVAVRRRVPAHFGNNQVAEDRMMRELESQDSVRDSAEDRTALRLQRYREIAARRACG